jgi:hypothetical protein
LVYIVHCACNYISFLQYISVIYVIYALNIFICYITFSFSFFFEGGKTYHNQPINWKWENLLLLAICECKLTHHHYSRKTTPPEMTYWWFIRGHAFAVAICLCVLVVTMFLYIQGRQVLSQSRVVLCLTSRTKASFSLNNIHKKASISYNHKL